MMKPEELENKQIGGWTSRQVLMHVTFWHESFTRNLQDLAIGEKPQPVKGTYAALNARCFEEMGNFSVESICGRLLAAQAVIRKHILDPEIEMIRYKVGSRSYTPEEHLDIVNEHIQSHLKELERVRARLKKRGSS